MNGRAGGFGAVPLFRQRPSASPTLSARRSRSFRAQPARPRLAVPIFARADKLAVERLDALAIGAQGQLVGPPIRAHVGLADRDQADRGVRQDRRLVRLPIVALIAIDGGLGGQAIGQFVDGRQVVQPAGEQVEGHRHARRGADQVQPPAEELLPLGRAVAAERLPAHLAATPRAGAAADWHRHAVDQEDLPGGEERAQRLQRQAEPVAQGVQAAIEARLTQPTGEVAPQVHHLQGPRQVALEVARRHHRHGQHLRVAGLRAHVVAVPQRRHRLVNDHEGRYDEVVVHAPLLPRIWCLSNTILRGSRMGGN